MARGLAGVGFLGTLAVLVGVNQPARVAYVIEPDRLVVDAQVGLSNASRSAAIADVHVAALDQFEVGRKVSGVDRGGVCVGEFVVGTRGRMWVAGACGRHWGLILDVQGESWFITPSDAHAFYGAITAAEAPSDGGWVRRRPVPGRWPTAAAESGQGWLRALFTVVGVDR